MKQIIITAALLSSFTSNAFELPSYTSGKVSKQLSLKQLSSLFKSKSPVCVKVGRKIVSANKAFLQLPKKKHNSLCGDSAKSKARQRAYGIEVTKLSVDNLPTSVLKKLAKAGLL